MAGFSESSGCWEEPWQAGRHREVALGMARVLLPAAGLCGGVLMAFRGSLHALLVSGPLPAIDGRPAAGPADAVGRRRSDGTPCRVRLTAGPGGCGTDPGSPLDSLPEPDRPSRLEAKPLLRAAQTGVGRERLLGEMERQVRDRAARSLRRIAGAVWLGLALAVALPFAAGWAVPLTRVVAASGPRQFRPPCIDRPGARW